MEIERSQEALQKLRRYAGTQFDPELSVTFGQIARSELADSA